MSDRQPLTNRRQPPSGWRRFAARLPIVLFRCGLGWIFGKRLLLLHHTGRVSGLDRRAVLEVVEYAPADGSLIVASGFGTGAAWYRNLRAHPDTLIQLGNRHYTVTAHFLVQEEGADVMARYATRHPHLARRLCTFLGLPADGTHAGFREAGRAIPFVRLRAGRGSPLP
ncbi:nitroreductase family deazaflavin-dependent oxidoreductase [Streptomyces sp. NPDC013313]|uniref:nitroreductase family deazaflavin-dependent oxidoreductase n=1 Tax=Streptomyces sp. NPDC013313 TaxID=3155603 RepID=UPI0033F6F24E